MNAEKKVTFTHNHNKRRGPSHGSDETNFPTDEDRRHLNYAKQISREGTIKSALPYFPNAFRNDWSRQIWSTASSNVLKIWTKSPETISRIKATDTTGRIIEKPPRTPSELGRQNPSPGFNRRTSRPQQQSSVFSDLKQALTFLLMSKNFLLVTID